jgi:hypothetical protein
MTGLEGRWKWGRHGGRSGFGCGWGRDGGSRSRVSNDLKKVEGKRSEASYSPVKTLENCKSGELGLAKAAERVEIGR